MNYFDIDDRLYLGDLVYQPATIEDWQKNIEKGRLNVGMG